jgi:uncharacterized protein (DUF302 family)
MKVIPLVLLLLAGLFSPLFADGLVTKPSHNSVSVTIEKMKAALDAKGIKILAEVDHQAGAKSVDMPLGEARLLLFGNPNLGTPLMQSSITAGIDLPMKLLVWQDGEGKVWLAYNDPQYIADRHGIKDREEVLKKMAGALNALTDKAAN